MNMDITSYRKTAFKAVLPIIDVKDIFVNISAQNFTSCGDDCHSFTVRFTKFYDDVEAENGRACKTIAEFDFVTWNDKKTNNKILRELKKFVAEFNINNY